MTLNLKKILCSALIWGGTFVSYGQVNCESPLTQDKKVLSGTLENGMSYYVRKHNNPAKHAEFYIVHNVGSLQEEDNQRGLAHFLEHMAFNGTKNFPDKLLLNYLNSIGVKFGSNVNAYTSMDRTVYNISQVPVASEAVLDSVLLMLHDWSYYITCDSLAIEAERGVIREEWRRGDDPRTRMMKAFFAIEQKGSRFAQRSPIGVMDVINNFRPSVLRKFYHDWYRPDLQSIIVVGDINPVEIEKKIKEIFSSIPVSENNKSKELYQIPANDNIEVEYYIDPELNAPSVRLLARFPMISIEKRKTLFFYQETLMQQMLAEGLRTRINNLVKNNTHSLYKTAIPAVGDIYYASRILRITALHNGNDFESALKGLLTDYILLARDGFTKDEFDIMLTNKKGDINKRKGRSINPKNSDYVDAAVESFTRGNVLTDIALNDEIYLSLLDKMSVEDMNSFINEYLSNVSPIIVFAGNDKDLNDFVPQERVVELYDSLKKSDLHIDLSLQSVDLKMKKQLPEMRVSFKGIIDIEKKISEYILENGNKVLFIKNSDHKDNISFKAVKKGGYSLICNENIYKARLTKSFQPSLMINGLDKTSFADYCKVNRFKILLSVDSRSSEISGSFDKTNIEPFFKALYLSMTDIDIADKDLSRMKRQMLKIAGNNTPNQIYKDSCASLSFERSLLMDKIPAKSIKDISREEVLDLYNQLYCNSDGFTFIIEGDVDFDDIEPYLQTYLSNLPFDKAKIKPIYRDSKWKDGKIDLRYKTNRTVSSKASVECSLKAKLKYNDKNQIYLKFIQSILKERYMSKIREEKGGTYTISVHTESYLYPTQSIAINTAFDTDPKLVDDLVNCVWSELEILDKDGATDGEIERVKLFLVKKITFVDDNKKSYSDKLVSDILGVPYVNDRNLDIINTITAKDLNLFIKSIIKQSNFTTFIIEP